MTEQAPQEETFNDVVDSMSSQKSPLNEGQQRAHDRVVQYVTGQGEGLPQIVLIKGYAGTGKAQPIHTPVLTPYGWRPIGALRVGDQIIGGDGKATTITGIFPQGKKDVAKIVMSDGTYTTACYDHLWFTSSYEERNRDRARKNKAKVKGSRYTAIKGSVKTTRDIAGSLYAREGIILNHKIPMVPVVEFAENFSTPSLDPYMLGCLIGDGCMTTNGVTITTPDKEIFGHMILPESTEIVPVKVSAGKCPCYGVRSNLKGYNYVNDILRKVGLLGCKSESKFIPDVYLFTTVENRIRLLQGLMDTDGTVGSKGYHVSYSTSSERLAHNVQFLVQSLGGVAIINHKPTDHLLSYNITVTLPSEISPFKLSRKAKAVVPKTKYTPTRFVTNVIEAGVEECVCISVDHPDRLYVTEHCIVTHNTFTINRIVETLKVWSNTQKWDKKLTIAASAPTHKAVRVMRKNSDMGSNITYTTIHSLFGIKPEIDFKTGKEVFKVSGDPEDGRVKEFNVLIFDEVSMLGVQLWQLIVDEAKLTGVKVILLGDPPQIPPVGELDSPAFLRPDEYGIEVLELTQSMRQLGDNPILDYATEIRTCYKTRFVEPIHKLVGDKGTYLLPAMDTQAVNQILEDRFCSPNFKADADFMKVIAWRNATVDSFNRKIRNMMYPIPEGMLSLPMIVNGEKLILDKRYMIPDTNGLSLPTNEELEVVSSQVVKKAIRYKLWTPIGYKEKSLNPSIYQTNVRYQSVKGGWVNTTIHIVQESSITDVAAMLKEIETSAKATAYGTTDRSEMWKHFFYIKNLFAEVKYNYAVTAHKSQGSTYTNCMLIQWDIAYNKKVEERNRITYVGATRPKNILYIVQ